MLSHSIHTATQLGKHRYLCTKFQPSQRSYSGQGWQKIHRLANKYRIKCLVIIGTLGKNKARMEVVNEKSTILARANCIGAVGRMSEWSRGASNGDTLGKNVPGRETSKYKCPEAEEHLRIKKMKDTGPEWDWRRGGGDKDLNPSLCPHCSLYTTVNWGDVYQLENDKGS